MHAVFEGCDERPQVSFANPFDFAQGRLGAPVSMDGFERARLCYNPAIAKTL